MQTKKKPINRPTADARIPFVLSFAISLMALVAVVLLCRTVDPQGDLVLYALVLLALDLVLCGALLLTYLARASHVRELQNMADELDTDMYDVFKYVVDLPYAITDAKGNVKAINRALQDILGLKSPLCNMPLSSFCSVAIGDIIRSTGEPWEVRHARALDERGEVVPGAHGFHIRMGDRRYELFAHAMRLRGQDFYLIFFQDVTDYLELREKMEKENPIVAYIVLDNLQELAQYVQVSSRSAANEIEALLKDWANEMGGLLREYDRDKFIMVCSAEALQRCIEDNFSIMNRVRAIKLGDNSFPVTISMGIAATGGSFRDREAAAGAALDIALQRGGDQVAIKRPDGLSFFGGRVKALQSNTSIISRVNANQLCALMANAGNVIIMGHRNPDFDAIGACVGLARLAMSALEGKDTEIRVVMNRECENFRICAEQLTGNAQYANLFVDAYNAQDLVRSDSLLILADANNVGIVECPELVNNIKDIAIIDHHRQFEVFDFVPALSYIHPSASSASELVAEMLEQSPYADTLRKEEATLLLAGIMLDTKSFSHSTGSQTFSAVHYLYAKGANTNVTRPFFHESMEDLITASAFGACSHVIHDRIALTWLDPSLRLPTEHINMRVAAAKAADRLLQLRGIDASFALVCIDGGVSISARSGDAINVQIIMEKLGGGGHFDMAGAQIKEATLEHAVGKLKEAIKDYLDHDLADHA